MFSASKHQAYILPPQVQLWKEGEGGGGGGEIRLTIQAVEFPQVLASFISKEKNMLSSCALHYHSQNQSYLHYLHPSQIKPHCVSNSNCQVLQ